MRFYQSGRLSGSFHIYSFYVFYFEKKTKKTHETRVVILMPETSIVCSLQGARLSLLGTPCTGCKFITWPTCTGTTTRTLTFTLTGWAQATINLTLHDGGRTAEHLRGTTADQEITGTDGPDRAVNQTQTPRL